MTRLGILLRRLIRGGATDYRRIPSWPEERGEGWRSAAATARLRGDQGAQAKLEGVGSGVDPSAEPVVLEHLDALDRIPLSDARLLDLGCGNGLYRGILSAHAHTGDWRYHGADVNEDLIAHCRRRWPDAEWQVVDGEEPLPYDDRSFDVVLASGVLLCVEDPGSLLSEIRRVCSGWALVSRVPVRKYAPAGIYLQRVWGRWSVESHPMHVFNRAELLSLFDRAGFEVAWADHGVECYSVPGEGEPVHHMLFLLKPGPRR